MRGKVGAFVGVLMEEQGYVGGEIEVGDDKLDRKIRIMSGKDGESV